LVQVNVLLNNPAELNIDAPLTYNSFITVIRQICKYNKIQYKNEIKYDKSSYDIYYYIFLESINEKSITS
jgi:hypothetical protein